VKKGVRAKKAGATKKAGGKKKASGAKKAGGVKKGGRGKKAGGMHPRRRRGERGRLSQLQPRRDQLYQPMGKGVGFLRL